MRTGILYFLSSILFISLICMGGCARLDVAMAAAPASDGISTNVSTPVLEESLPSGQGNVGEEYLQTDPATNDEEVGYELYAGDLVTVVDRSLGYRIDTNKLIYALSEVGLSGKRFVVTLQDEPSFVTFIDEQGNPVTGPVEAVGASSRHMTISTDSFGPYSGDEVVYYLLTLVHMSVLEDLPDYGFDSEEKAKALLVYDPESALRANLVDQSLARGILIAQ